MNETTSYPTYAVRASVLEDELTWRLMPDALERHDPPVDAQHTATRFPYCDIASVRLSYAGSRVDASRYRCDLRTRGGERLAIMSTHYVGFAEFEDRTAGYVPFVRALVVRVAAANPSASFRSGKSVLAFSVEYGILLFTIVLAIALFWAIGPVTFSESSWAKFWVILGSIPLLVVYTRKNWPRAFKPDAIPSDVMPAGN